MTMTSARISAVLGAAAAATLLVPGVAGAATAASGHSASTRPGSVPAWAGPAANAPGGTASQPAGGRFYGVAATRSGAAWAVGLNDGGSFIMRWTGRWVQALTGPGYFAGVSAPSARDVWAVE